MHAQAPAANPFGGTWKLIAAPNRLAKLGWNDYSDAPIQAETCSVARARGFIPLVNSRVGDVAAGGE